MKTLHIIGAGGHGKVVAECAELLGYNSINFYDDRWPSLSKVGIWPVVANTETLFENLHPSMPVFVAIGENSVRLELVEKLLRNGNNVVSLMHPNSQISSYSKVGPGSLLLSGSVLNAFSALGTACIINTNATVEHDCSIGSGVHISPAACLCGGVTVGKRSWVGASASIIQLIKIGKNSVIGAGSVVLYDVLDDVTVVGNPAKLVSKKVKKC